MLTGIGMWALYTVCALSLHTSQTGITIQLVCACEETMRERDCNTKHVAVITVALIYDVRYGKFGKFGTNNWKLHGYNVCCL